ncbi:MAG TPA: flagellin [Paraburkholderia sp.]|uniref:flagellin n=1 Tax=Paraburkholderia sp. TaxID=1926495 RepID=UPI002B47D0B9|nr:flagellin [Paraburkholderia sp.]HKR40279.1 flagellin [Paraburkholderia sp.]
MLGINSNINSLVAQQNLTGSGSALSQAITRLSSGKRINSAADDAAGLAISNIMQTQINGLNQGVSNSNDGVSIVQTASSGLASLTSSLQRVRQLATQAANGSVTNDDRKALQQEVNQQLQEINRIASQTTYNGMNVLNGTMGNVSFQVGANVGQTISLGLTQNMSAATIGGGNIQKGNVLGSMAVSLTATGTAAPAGTTPAVTQLNIVSDGNGGYSLTDQNSNSVAFTGATLFTQSTSGVLQIKSGGPLDQSATQLAAINTAEGTNPALAPAAGTTLGTVTGLNIDSTTGLDAVAGKVGDITAVTVKSDGAGDLTFTDQNGAAFSGAVLAKVKTALGYTAPGANSATLGPALGAGVTDSGIVVANVATANTVDKIDIGTQAGANTAMLSIDNALATVNNLQATLGAAQNRFSAIGATQQVQSTDLATAQSSIQDANFAQETANLSKAQVLQQAGISVLAQANSQPQQILKLLQ